jgi:hypothetical protein
VTLEQLVQVTQWKMARGVWRARNLELVKNNAQSDIVESSQWSALFGPMPAERKRPITR